MNPWDADEIFHFSGRNPNVSLRKGKEGPVWRISWEVEEEVALNCTHTETAGMNMDFAAQVTARNEPLPDKPKGGKISQEAGMLCREDKYNEYAQSQYINDKITDHRFDNLKSMIYDRCNITSRAELDHNDEARHKFTLLKSRMFNWCEAKKNEELKVNSEPLDQGNVY